MFQPLEVKDCHLFHNFQMPDMEARLTSVDRNNLNNLLNPLLKLRQSCCHPQAVKGQFMKLQETTMTMEEILDQMIKKVRLYSLLPLHFQNKIGITEHFFFPHFPPTLKKNTS